MKSWRRLGAALVTVLALAAALTGTALAAEPAQSGGIAVQLDGAPLSFTDAVPEISNGRTCLPFRSVLEAMGAQVDFDPQTSTISARRGGVSMTMVPGQKQLAVTQDGQTRTVEMDTAPYIKPSNGRTYVPIRYAAEALGYNVGWDAAEATVILVDVDALFGDATFQLMDRFSAYCSRNEPENQAVTGTLSIDVTDKTGAAPRSIQASGSIDGIVGDKGAQLQGKLSLSGLSELLAGEIGAASPMEQIMVQQLLSSLSNLSCQLRLDLDTEMLYFSLPADLTGTDAWYSVDLSGFKAELLNGLDLLQLEQTEDASIRETLVWALRSVPLEDAFSSYDALSQVSSVYVELFSDQAFTRKGNTYVASTVLEDILNMEITLTARGEDIVSMDLAMTASGDEDGTKMTLAVTGSSAPDKAAMSMDMEISGFDLEFVFRMDLTCVPTRQVPQTLPPAGVQVVPMA